jgi:hypothetical protein
VIITGSRKQRNSITNKYGQYEKAAYCYYMNHSYLASAENYLKAGNERLIFRVASFLKSNFGGDRRNKSFDSSQS